MDIGRDSDSDDECGGSKLKRRRTLKARSELIQPALVGIVGRLLSLETQKSYDIMTDKRTYVIGRGPDCDIVTEDYDYISSRHCILRVETVGPSVVFKLEDCSTNGTYVNNTHIVKGDIQLKLGDHIDLFGNSSGSRRVSFILLAASSPTDSPIAARPQAATVDSSAISAPCIPQQSSSSSLSTSDVPVVAAAAPDPTPVTSFIAPGVEQKLQCVICQELLYKAATAVPCMHSYCGGCISAWHKRSSRCPLCNTGIKQVSRNHTLDSLVDEVLQCRPSLARAPEELRDMDVQDTIKYGVPLSSNDSDDEDDDDDDDDDDNNDDDSDDDDHSDGGAPVIPPLPHVPQIAVPQQDVDEFKMITGCSDATARRILAGTIARNLNPVMDYALTYYYEQNVGAGP